jgi:hypothetical protein
MALNFDDRKSVLADQIMQSRIASLVLNYATFLQGDGGSTVGEKSWAKAAAVNPNGVARDVSNYIFSWPDFIADGSGVTDGSLKSAVEAAVDSYFVVEP